VLDHLLHLFFYKKSDEVKLGLTKLIILKFCRFHRKSTMPCLATNEPVRVVTSLTKRPAEKPVLVLKVRTSCLMRAAKSMTQAATLQFFGIYAFSLIN
jgi:hypothetical protein